ncbi:long-chain fatty acid--CoA ligase [Halobacteriales archaeon QS_8_69_26]|nr:MAG: long-chain fatty acid--CoA ligase [Halobacteriales archaeon QS_8_69_26]
MTDQDPVHDHSARPYGWVGAYSERRAALSPDAVGLRDASSGASFTYAELDRRANRTARLLSAHGVADGERVAVVSRNRPELVDLFFGACKTGGVLAPLSHRLAPPEMGALLDDVDPELLVVEAPFADDVAAALAHGNCGVDAPALALGTGGIAGRAEPDPDPVDSDLAAGDYAGALPEDDSPVETADLALSDPALFLHTGGSTGVPKETVLTHGSVLWNSFNTITAWGLRPDDVTPMTFPMFHTGGWNVITVPLFHVGGEVIVAREFDPAEVLGLVDETEASLLIAVPAVLRMMADHDDWEEADLSTLRFVKSGGGPCRERVMREWWERDVDLSQGYGLTECGPNNFAMPEGWDRATADSVGVPAPHVDTRVVGDDGGELDRGEIGELELAGPHAADRYWRNPEESEATFGDGWVSTGDLARVDEDGYHYVEGRKKNMYVSGGENVYPAEVEDAIADHPGVEEVVVVPVPDEQWGQVGRAVVQGDRTIDLESLREFLDGRLARFKHPRSVAFVDEMPTSGPSKIDREAIKAEFGDEE